MIIYNNGKEEFRDFLLTEDSFDEMHLGKTESIMCQGNGYLCIRGAAEEDYVGKTANTFIAGTFNATSENEVTELPNVADCFSMEIKIDGKRFYLTEETVINYSKTLNIKTGELIRTFQYKTKDNLIAFEMKRFVSADDLHLCVQQVSIKALEKACEIIITSGINNRASNSGEMHFVDDTRRFFEKEYIYTKAITTTSNIAVYINACHRLYQNGVEVEKLAKPLMNRRQAFQQYKFELKVNDTIKIEKYCSYYTSIDNAAISYEDPEHSYLLLKKEKQEGYDKLFQKSVKTLQVKLWQRDYIEIGSENKFDQLAINYAMYQLYVMTPAHDERMNIGAKGLSGEGYKGHTFWDTEVFILPRFIVQNPQVAKKLLIYRYLGLKGARRKAEDSGFHGAMFPWEAANPDDGEVTPIYNGIDVYTGEQDLVKTGFMEIHITSDVAFGVYTYYNFTKDEEFMQEYGYEIIMETAKFWSSRLETSEMDDLLHINKVIGPDEYSENVDDNAYTNYLAKWNMEYAVEIYDKLVEENKDLLERLCQTTGINQYINEIKEKANQIYISAPDEHMIIEQDRTFRDLKELDLTKYKEADKVGVILEDYNLEQVSEYKVSKQADIMVLFLLFGEKWNNQIKEANFNYYEPYCLHDSSLSFSTYSILANDIGNTSYSYELFQHACNIDIGQQMNACDTGIHAASYGGVWQCIMYGFVGLRMIDRKLNFQPQLPKEITHINFSMYYEEQPLQIHVDKERITIENCGNKPVEIIVNGNIKMVSEGAGMEVIYNTNNIELVIFDLDGVLVDTAKYHYLAWKKLGEELGFEFTEEQNEAFKGVSRMACMDIMCEHAGLQTMPQRERERLANKKNELYLELIQEIDRSELLSGVEETMDLLQENEVKIALGSASKNAVAILEKTGIIDRFDTIIDGTKVSKAKPDPEVFVLGAESLGIDTSRCVVFEDAQAGVEAALAAGMKCIGIGSSENLPNAELLLPNVGELTMEMLGSM